MGKFGGYISLHRQILDWGWYQNANTFRLFIHLLLKANFDESVFMGRIIHRGQIVTSFPRLADEIGLTIKEVRVALDHLIKTGEVADESTHQYRVITVLKYDEYQNTADEMAGKRQTKGRRRADGRAVKGQHNNNINKDNKDNNGINKREGTFVPPTLEEVQSYVREKGFRMDAGAFFDHYAANGWVMKGGQKIKDWKAAARNWERREKDGFGRTGGQQQGAGAKRVDYSWLPD